MKQYVPMLSLLRKARTIHILKFTKLKNSFGILYFAFLASYTFSIRDYIECEDALFKKVSLKEI